MIDFHTHCYPDALAPAVNNTIDYFDAPENHSTATGLFKELDKAGADLAVVLAVATKPGSEQKVNSFAAGLDPKRFVPFASVHPQSPNALDLLDEVKAAGFKGIKLHPPIKKFFVNDIKLKPYFKKVGDLGLITVFHAGSDPTHPSTYDNRVFHFAQAIEWFGGAPVVLAHMGGPDIDWDQVELFRQLPVYVDTSIACFNMPERNFMRVLENVGPERVLFGSDYPYSFTKSSYARLCKFPIDSKSLDLIADKNARRLLGLL